MKQRCSHCGLTEAAEHGRCSRCGMGLGPAPSGLYRRAAVLIVVCIALVLGFWLSLAMSANRLTAEQQAAVDRAIDVLRDRGFADEAWLLTYFTIYRADDNWLNAAVAKENAYAATNFPFQIMTLYADMFTYPEDDVERAAILLHEARHLYGENEADAYRYVWLNREKLGWTNRGYAHSPVWRNVRQQTREHLPAMFNCPENEYSDCTGLPRFTP